MNFTSVRSLVNSRLTVIAYNYDRLYRLANANYSSGQTFTYTHDAVGNRLSQSALGLTTVYTYDIANQLVNAGGQAYTWDNNGNLLYDSAMTYAYDDANRPMTMTQGANVYAFAYNGAGDRVKQTVNGTPTNYTLDLNAGLTQVLADGSNVYLYGNGRVAQYAGATSNYFLGDALGSVRQLANSSGAVTLAKSYQPYGSVMSSSGAGSSMYGFTGEQTDATNLQYLRARYYAPGQGRFVSKDTWAGDTNRPMSYNGWLYTFGNPTNWTDPSGNIPCNLLPGEDREACEQITGAELNPPDPTSGISSALPICNPDLIHFGEPCIPVECLFPPDILHPLDTVLDNPGNYKGYGQWFHYLLRRVPGWWNEQGGASEEKILINLIALTLSAEISPDAFQHTRLIGAMAEAFARKAWDAPQGFYGFIGSRQSLKSRMVETLYINRDPVTHIGTWDRNSSARAQRFTSMVNALRLRYPQALGHARNILYTPSWHHVEPNTYGSLILWASLRELLSSRA